MSFDIEGTIEDMVSAVSGVISGEWPEVKDCVKQALEDEKEALEEIAKARINGEIDDEDMKSQLEDEKVALEAALLACQVKAKAAAQKAVNAAVDVFRNAVSAAI
jgi:hypothetical protein